MTDETKKRIEDIVGNNDIVLFMKGTPDFPGIGKSGYGNRWRKPASIEVSSERLQ